MSYRYKSGIVHGNNFLSVSGVCNYSENPIFPHQHDIDFNKSKEVISCPSCGVRKYSGCKCEYCNTLS